MEQPRFNAAQVASLATEIERLAAEAKQLRKDAEQASSVANSAEVRLANKRIEFTRAVESQLDRSSLQIQRGLRESA